MAQDNSTELNAKALQENKLPENLSAIINATNKNADKLVDFSVLRDEQTLLGLFRQFMKAVWSTVASTLWMEWQLSPEEFSVLVDARKRYSALMEQWAADNYLEKWAADNYNNPKSEAVAVNDKK